MASIPAQAPPAPPLIDRESPPRLAPGQLHELHADDTGWAPALLFALAQTRAQAPLLLVRMKAPLSTTPYGEALCQIGRDPQRILIVEAASTTALLRAAHEGARCATLGGVILETWGPLRDYDLVASRRLVLAAETSGVPVMLLRGAAQPRPSAAHTRWQVASAPSASPPSPAQRLRLPGPPALTLDLLRQRGGPAGGRWHLEWNDTDATFRLARPLSLGAIPAPARSFGAIMAGTVVSLGALRKGVAQPDRNAA